MVGIERRSSATRVWAVTLAVALGSGGFLEQVSAGLAEHFHVCRCELSQDGNHECRCPHCRSDRALRSRESMPCHSGAVAEHSEPEPPQLPLIEQQSCGGEGDARPKWTLVRATLPDPPPAVPAPFVVHTPRVRGPLCHSRAAPGPETPPPIA